VTISHSDPSGRPKRHLLKAMGVVTAATALIGLAAAPAFAEAGQRCADGPDRNACLEITQLDSNHYRSATNRCSPSR
jgi:hypothetical protein